MGDEEKKQAFLALIKSEGRSSPTGMYWADFHTFLKSQITVAGDPPVPLILAASGASDSAKHQRLSEQLDWAIANDCFAEAIAFLENLAADRWNYGSPDKWDTEFFGV